jgi:hypothetical protein
MKNKGLPLSNLLLGAVAHCYELHPIELVLSQGVADILSNLRTIFGFLGRALEHEQTLGDCIA